MSDRSAALKGKRILIVEDEMVVAMLLEDMVEDLGCQVAATAARTSEALSAIASIEIDAAILDLNLDGERSYAIADELIARGIPLVFSTGYGAGALDPKYRDHTVLGKPFRLADLAEVFARLFAPADRSE